MEITELEINGQRIIVAGPVHVFLKDRGKRIQTSNGSVVAEVRYFDKRKNPGGGYKLSHKMKDVFIIKATS